MIRHVDCGTIPGGVALLGAGNVGVVTAGVASVGGGPMGAGAIMRIQSMTKAVTSVAALRLVEAGRLGLDQSVVDWLPELADRRVLRRPTADLDDTVPARRPITLRHLLTNSCGYGVVIQASPLQQAMAANGTEAGPEPPAMGAEEWLRRLAEHPLAFQPGEGWRYHHSFGVLGILISRVTGRPLGRASGRGRFRAARDDRHRAVGGRRASWTGCLRLTGTVTRDSWRSSLPVAVSTQGPPSFDVSHGELVSTAAGLSPFRPDTCRRRAVNGQPMISPDHLQQMTSDQVPGGVQDCGQLLLPGVLGGHGMGFWRGRDRHEGPQRGRIGWSGGLGTDFFVDPDGTVGILLTQVEMGKDMGPLVAQFQSLHEPS